MRDLYNKVKSLLYHPDQDPYGVFEGKSAFPTYHWYQHTHLSEEMIDEALSHTQNHFWLEIGSMYGGSAIKAVQRAKETAADLFLLCVDPFCGDVSMWELNARDPELMELDGVRPTILDRFLGNVKEAGIEDAILPLPTTSTIGMRLIERFLEEGKLQKGPGVIYLDSAHEWDETYLELEIAWRILDPGGVLMGDDLDWPAVDHDVKRFVSDKELTLDKRGVSQWMIKKPIDYPHIASPFYQKQENLDLSNIFSTMEVRDFDAVYERGLWGWEGNGSGTGSMMHTTVAVRELFARLIEEEGVRTIVDVSAGGMLWWPEVLEKYPEVKFYGYDISKIKTEENRAKFAHQKNWEFHVGDVTSTTYPSCDLLICRHTLNHLSVTDVTKSILNLRKSDARMVAITQHLVDDFYNETLIADDTVGCIDYRPIDLRKSPLNMPEPFLEIDDADAEDVQMDWQRKFSIWKMD